ncbi:MAG: hypothetical protein KKD31_01855 [Bacteroidetes bacterium]|nr:hypothetical protein [Bacteroidota bacterium]
MKSLLLPIVVLLIVFSCQKEEEISPNQLQYRKFYEYGAGYDEMFASISHDHQLIVSFQLDTSTVALWKISSRGILIWRKRITYDSWVTLQSIIISNENHIFLIGTSNVYSTPPENYFLTRISSGGDFEWTKEYGGSEMERCGTSIMVSDGNIIICGLWQEGCGPFASYLVKVNVDGDTIWTRTIPEADYFWTTDVIELKDGSGFIMLNYGALSNDGIVRVRKVDQNGLVIWERNLFTSRPEYGYPSLVEDNNGDLLIFSTIDNSPKEISLIRTDANAVIRWEKFYSLGPKATIAEKFIINDDGTYTIYGKTWLPEDPSPTRVGFIKIDINGKEIFRKTFDVDMRPPAVLRLDNRNTYLFWRRVNFLYMTKIDQNGNPVMLDQW